MSRIGKLPIQIPENVDINYSGSEVTVKGKFGTLQTTLPDVIQIVQNENFLKDFNICVYLPVPLGPNKIKFFKSHMFFGNLSYILFNFGCKFSC